MPHQATGFEEPVTDTLITPERGEQLRRAALRHAGMMIMIGVGEWDPSEYVRTGAERELLLAEVERHARELLARARAGTRCPCPTCGLPYQVKTDGTMHRHHGIDEAGFSTGAPCDGVNQPPRAA